MERLLRQQKWRAMFAASAGFLLLCLFIKVIMCMNFTNYTLREP